MHVQIRVQIPGCKWTSDPYLSPFYTCALHFRYKRLVTNEYVKPQGKRNYKVHHHRSEFCEKCKYGKGDCTDSKPRPKQTTNTYDGPYSTSKTKTNK